MPILSGARPARLPAISLLSKFRARGRVRSRELRNAGEIRLCGYGGDNHVVAEAELRPGERVLVDSQNPPHARDLEPLDEVILRLEYYDYSTLHLRRLHLNWLVSRVKLELGPLTYWTENPHALKSGLWLALAMTLLVGKFLFMGERSPARILLARGGWAPVVDERDFEVGPNEVG